MRYPILILCFLLSACSPPTAEQKVRADKYCSERGMEVYQNINTNQIKCIIRKDYELPQFYSIPASVLGDDRQ